MRTHSPKFLNNVKVTSAAAAAAAARSSMSTDYYKDTRLTLPRIISTTTTTAGDGNDNSSPFTATLTRKTGSPFSSMGLAVAVVLTSLCFVGFCCAYTYCLSEHNYPNPRRRQHRSQRYRYSSSGVDPSTIQSLPLFTYDGNHKGTIDCSICLTEFQKEEMIKVIPFCSHFFHPQCIDMWLSAHGSCPLCRSTQLLRPLAHPPPPPHHHDHKDPFTCFVAMGREVPLALPPPLPSSSSSSSSSSAVTRVNSFSSSSGIEDRVHSLPRSFSF